MSRTDNDGRHMNTLQPQPRPPHFRMPGNLLLACRYPEQHIVTGYRQKNCQNVVSFAIKILAGVIDFYSTFAKQYARPARVNSRTFISRFLEDVLDALGWETSGRLDELKFPFDHPLEPLSSGAGAVEGAKEHALFERSMEQRPSVVPPVGGHSQRSVQVRLLDVLIEATNSLVDHNTKISEDQKGTSLPVRTENIIMVTNSHQLTAHSWMRAHNNYDSHTTRRLSWERRARGSGVQDGYMDHLPSKPSVGVST
ncbi:hypothetical protein BJ165DRAFT_1407411 [Panaeolus papilionaceus]|nr:hypothetical protein BJ165DRAFT_1407411 [Panaeolus papilionaceus]